MIGQILVVCFGAFDTSGLVTGTESRRYEPALLLHVFWLFRETAVSRVTSENKDDWSKPKVVVVLAVNTVVLLHQYIWRLLYSWYLCYHTRVCKVAVVGSTFFRSTLQSRPKPNKASLKCPFVRTYVYVYVCTSVHKTFLRFQWNLACR